MAAQAPMTGRIKSRFFTKQGRGYAAFSSGLLIRH